MDGRTYQPFTAKQAKSLGQQWVRLFSGWHWMTRPYFDGLEHLPDTGPVLLVGNHSIMAFADACLMTREIYLRKGIVCRSLGLHEHFKIPVWGKLLSRNGVVDGTRDNCRAMMQAGEFIVVYPGGGGEVMKRKGEQHQLRWKNRTGFAQMAIENRCTVVPFSTVGADDCYDILVDNRQIAQSRIGQQLIALSGLKAEEFPPLLKGIGPTLLPKPQRMYFRFHAPIDAGDFAGENLQAASLALRQTVEHTVQSGINALLEQRANDPERLLSNRIRHTATQVLTRFKR